MLILLFHSVCFLHLILFSYISHFQQGFCPGRTKICLQNHRKLPEEENLLLETAVFLLNVLLFRVFTFIFLFESKLPADDIDNILYF